VTREGGERDPIRFSMFGSSKRSLQAVGARGQRVTSIDSSQRASTQGARRDAWTKSGFPWYRRSFNYTADAIQTQSRSVTSIGADVMSACIHRTSRVNEMANFRVSWKVRSTGKVRTVRVTDAETRCKVVAVFVFFFRKNLTFRTASDSPIAVKFLDFTVRVRDAERVVFSLSRHSGTPCTALASGERGDSAPLFPWIG